MYIPHPFTIDDHQESVDFIKQYSFGTIINVKDNIPLATHLPFVVNEQPDKLVLTSHFALANEQAKLLEETTSLVIFSEPHAYISPTHYDKQESVPTWNYLAVHAYGQATIIAAEAGKRAVLEQMIHFYEQQYMQQWNSLSDKFIHGMMKGIVAFEIEVSQLQGKKKLSQNKTEIERNRIIAQLEGSEHGVEKELAAYMKWQ